MTTDMELDALIAARLGWKRAATTIAVPHVDGWGRELPGPDPRARMMGEDAWEGSEALFGYRLKVSRAYHCGTGWFQPTRDELQARIVRDVLSHEVPPGREELMGLLGQ